MKNIHVETEINSKMNVQLVVNIITLLHTACVLPQQPSLDSRFPMLRQFNLKLVMVQKIKNVRYYISQHSSRQRNNYTSERWLIF